MGIQTYTCTWTLVRHLSAQASWPWAVLASLITCGVAFLMAQILLAMLRQEFPLFSWILGRQTMARLLCSSRKFLPITPMHKQFTMLHDITSQQPLGSSQCSIDDVAWLCMNLHVSLDRAPTDDTTFIFWCPQCEATFASYLYASVRYQILRKLEGAGRILSELDAASDSGDVYWARKLFGA